MENHTHGVHGFMGDPLIKRGIVAVLILLAVFLALKSVSLIREYPLIGGGVPATNTITINGEGEVFAVPDTATFTFSVVEEGATVEQAQERATQKSNDLIAFLEREGVEEKDIKTTSYNVNPRYEFRRNGGVEIQIFPPQGERELVGFEVRQTIQVKVRDTEKTGALLSGIGSRGVTDVYGPQFTIDDEEVLQVEARKMAILDAQKKAKELAKDLDVRLIRVVSFNEFGGSFPRFGFAEAQSVGSDDGIGGSIPEIPAGENKITSNISITYEIR